MEKYRILYVDKVDIENGFEAGQIVKGRFEMIFNTDKGYREEVFAVYDDDGDGSFILYKEQIKKMSNINKEVQTVLDYCNELDVAILSISVYNREFMIQREDGTPTMCSFDEIEELKD